jgi:hypothetical protein
MRSAEGRGAAGSRSQRASCRRCCCQHRAASPVLMLNKWRPGMAAPLRVQGGASSSGLLEWGCRVVARSGLAAAVLSPSRLHALAITPGCQAGWPAGCSWLAGWPAHITAGCS